MDSLSVTLAAVSDPTRRAILQQLARGPAPIRDLAEPHRISQQAVSKHVDYLERARLVEKRREGRLQICRLTPAPLKEVNAWSATFRELWEARLDHLETLLDELQQTPTKRRSKR